MAVVLVTVVLSGFGLSALFVLLLLLLPLLCSPQIRIEMKKYFLAYLDQ